MSRLKVFVSVITVLFKLSPACGQTPHEVFSRHFSAIGGETMLKKMKSVSRGGKIDFPDHGQASPNGVGNYRTDVVFDFKLRVRIQLGNYHSDEIKNGSSYWEQRSGRFLEITDRLKQIELDETARIANKEILSWEGEHEALKIALSKPKWARRSICVSGRRQDVDEYACFDRVNHLLTAVGSENEYRLYSSWKLFGSLKFPTRLVQVKNQMVSYQIQIETIDVDSPIDDGVFHPLLMAD